MKNKSIVAFVAALLIIGVLLTSCSKAPAGSTKYADSATLKPSEGQDTTAITDPISEDYNAVYIMNNLEKIKFETFNDLNVEAENIFEGEVIKTESIYHNKVLSQISTVKVTHVYKGDLKIGQYVPIDELGGVTTQRKYYYATGMDKEQKEGMANEPPEDTTLVIGYDGILPSVVGDVALFITSGPSDFYKGTLSYPTYCPIGAMDGTLYKQSDGNYYRMTQSDLSGAEVRRKRSAGIDKASADLILTPEFLEKQLGD